MHKQPYTLSYPSAIQTLCQQQQDQISAILQSITISDPKYTDNEINHLINPSDKHNRYSNKNSIYSAASENDQNNFQSRQNSLGSDYPKLPQKQQSQDQAGSEGFQDGFDLDHDNEKSKDNQDQSDINELFIRQFTSRNPNSQIITPLQRFNRMKSQKSFPFTQIYQQLHYLQVPFTSQQVQKQYPSFLISKPSYKLQSTANQKKSAFDLQGIKSSFSIIDIASPSKNTFYMAAANNSNKVIIHELYSAKPYQIVQVFKPGQKVKYLKWSDSLQYLIVSNQSNQVKLFQFKQFNNQTNNNEDLMKKIKTPLELWSLFYPKIKSNIIDAHFIEENPIKVLLIDEEYEIYFVEMKKQFLSLKPNVTKLPIQFSPFFQMKLIKLSNSKQYYGTLIVVGGQDYVTFAMIQPTFQIVLVYDKEKHFPQAKRGGYPNIIFVANQQQQISPQIMIVWDKHMELIKLKIQEFQPFTYKIHTLLKYTFPDSSIMVGSLSSTLIYQLTRLQLKIYSLNQISKFNQNINDVSEANNSSEGNNCSVNERKQIKFAQPIYSKKIDFEQFPQGQRLQEVISNHVLQLQDLSILSNFFSVCQNTLFICFEDCLYSLGIKGFPSYVETTIQGINDWKVGLQLINDGIMKQITQFDQMSPIVLAKQLKQYSSRYIQFLKGVIPDTNLNNQIWKQQMCFLFNILIQSGQQKYLMKQILMKLYRVSPQLLKIYEPFIMMGLLTEIDIDTLDLLLSVIDRQAGKRLIYSIRNSITVSDHSELAHLINNILIRYEMYLELIWINQYFADYYTPFVIIVSKFEQNYNKKEGEIIGQIQSSYQQQHKVKPDKQFIQDKLTAFRQQKAHMVKLLSFLCFDTFKLINLSQYCRFFAEQDKFHISRVKSKYLIETLIPIMHSKLNTILIQNNGQQLFDYVLEEMFYGNSLNALSELSSGHDSHSFNNLMVQIVDNLSYKLIVETRNQGRYWLLVMRLMIRKIVTRKVIPGLYYLTLEQPHQSTTLSQLIDLFIKDCSQSVCQQLYSMAMDQKVDFFDKLKQSQQQYLIDMNQYVAVKGDRGSAEQINVGALKHDMLQAVAQCNYVSYY